MHGVLHARREMLRCACALLLGNTAGHGEDKVTTRKAICLFPAVGHGEDEDHRYRYARCAAHR